MTKYLTASVIWFLDYLKYVIQWRREREDLDPAWRAGLFSLTKWNQCRGWQIIKPKCKWRAQWTAWVLLSTQVHIHILVPLGNKMLFCIQMPLGYLQLDLEVSYLSSWSLKPNVPCSGAPKINRLECFPHVHFYCQENFKEVFQLPQLNQMSADPTERWNWQSSLLVTPGLFLSGISLMSRSHLLLKAIKFWGPICHN